ncbi:hypothetical protein HANVADRAFT_53437 [Hanseniaspora valbyensis NRRL Y-1626]|uniref:Protein BNI4 n=1 Tax=Hanseniaspora valbyensis NRRL Y-1626 TaxID=766949 RepID=A0A1B7TBF8_9ASCO|nr:hypothetical protein HANVADRAFT_53437 [Hanseniaspora valbyensis NRRL Y-1626]
MSDQNNGKKLQPLLNKAGMPVKKRDKSKRYSMFYESTEHRNNMAKEQPENDDTNNDDNMVKSNSLNDLDEQEDKSKVSSLRHAKNLRSSLFVKQDDDMVKYMHQRFEKMENIKNNNVSNTNKENISLGQSTNSNSSAEEEEDEDIDGSQEVKTMNIQFSSSPSLSALAGYLNNNSPPKNKNTNILSRKPFNKNMNNIFEEEDEEVEQLEERENEKEKKFSLAASEHAAISAKETFKTPAEKIEKQNLVTNNKLKETQPLKLSQPSAQPISTFNKRTTSLSKDSIKKKEQQEDKQKKTSIFSIFRKKSINRKLSKNENEYLPVSETFSNKLAGSANNRNNKSSVLSSLRQVSESKASQNDSSSSNTLPKTRRNSTTDDVPVQRKDVGLRNSTPMNFDQTNNSSNNSNNNNKKVSVSNSETSNMTIKSSPKILGEDVFPKHLDLSEISSIQTLEKAKRASLTLTPNNKRMSLTDSISVKQENEGMFVEYDSNLQIHTPDLSKSPTSSILRSGRFENNRNSMVLSDSGRSTNRNSLILSDTGRRSNRNSRYENRISILSNGNNSKNAPNDQILEEDIQKPEAPLLNIDFDFEDSEYVSEIMEFKNIIDFGDYIDLDFSTTEKKDSGILNDINYNETENNSSMVLNGLGILSTSKEKDTEEQELYEEPVKDVTPELNTKEEPFQPYLPTITPASPETPRKVRPLSMSFKGLNTKNEFDNWFEDEEEEEKEREKELDHEKNDIIKKDDYTTKNEEEKEEEAEEAEEQLDTEEEYYNNDDEVDGDEEEDEEDFNFYDTLEEDEIEVYNDEIDDYVDENFPVNSNKGVRFASKIILFDTYSAEEYDRRPDLATCNQLTAELAMFIREEVNTMKGEMEIHSDSIQYTHFL